ncbi:HAD superfamily hydrolase [Natronomonas moolapensis 8.8.11]|uniref:HAD superfamily hydrolase n=1 Tax=Natronomonas moolapensis (strain DSM 18674 / CECT 7526 / JCM 14361 / 8.8.11) TaxID=268739 RepID=M1XPZ0_NATM8|nr:HAD family hydrolase [Natronomonas moolapensis]CCQ36112.1 HAD superfamily hydrolase [Natronomonas moolapensis 8.8.11]
MNYDAVVLDMDGVVIEPTDRAVIRESITDTFGEFGVDSPSPALVERLLDQEVPTETLRERHGIDPAEFWTQREHGASQAQIEAADRGAKAPYDDVSVLDELPTPLGLVSNNQRPTVEFLLEHHGLTYFETAYGREPTLTGAARKKPDPHYIERALADLDADTALYVGDSNVDVEAAHRAEVDSAFVRRPHRTDYALEREPTYELSTLAGLTGILGSS